MKKKRNLFEELVKRIEEIKEFEAGKITLKATIVEPKTKQGGYCIRGDETLSSGMFQ
ncbi:hypothetical protein [Geobacter sp. FeAm09]|uniref:hypothetical protein n=1 Tax=Geobacter sp. FeAm09 TaxID=2597769 RepID=UPI00143CF1CE|nr:hypothetical protein [Geobacter sp. FeAm09]